MWLARPVSIRALSTGAGAQNWMTRLSSRTILPIRDRRASAAASMEGVMNELTTINSATAAAIAADMKVALLATLDAHNLPHVTLITTIQARDPSTIIWGQFTEGYSKQNVHTNPKTAFLVMSLARKIWRGRALWKEERKEGPEYEMYNNKPMWRYNTYFGIHTVHYMQLVGITEGLPLPHGAGHLRWSGDAAGAWRSRDRK